MASSSDGTAGTSGDGDDDLVARLRSFVGQEGSAQLARDPVNQPMIRHWCDAMSDHNPIYTDPEAAAASCHGEIVAPPAMLQAWGMFGLAPRPAPSGEAAGSVYAALDQAGFTSVVATNCEHEYPRYLRLGDHLCATASVEDVSEEKKTGLGVGHFVTTRTEYRTQAGERVGAMNFRILKFKPGTGRAAPPGETGATPRPKRPRPGISRDTRFFWDGAQQGELRIQECRGCRSLFHPPVVRCPRCGAYDLGHRVSGGRGTVYSFVEPCHPKVPSFDYPLIVGLVELEEGTRLLTNIVDVDPETVHIGMPVELVCREENSERPLPLFRPRRPTRRPHTLHFEDVQVGDELAPWPISITPTLIVSTAIASRDYQDVHHDRDLAIKRGSPDIFMNILTSGGLAATFVTDWAGPEAVLQNLSIRLGAPNYPYDVMILTGSVTAAERGNDRGCVEVSFRGTNRIGDHVTGRTRLALPSRSGGGA